MLFNASPTYAPGEPQGGVPMGEYQSVDWLGRYHLDWVKPYSAWIGLGGLALVAYLLHRSGGRR